MMRHVSESIVLTWIGCFKRISRDPGILAVHGPTKEQVADILYKGFSTPMKERIVYTVRNPTREQIHDN